MLRKKINPWVALAVVILAVAVGVMYYGHRTTFFKVYVKVPGFKGRVLDATTREPIEGAVVLVEWRDAESAAFIVEARSRFVDAVEAATDKEGYFELPSIGWQFFVILTPPSFRVFKAGYQYVDVPVSQVLHADDINHLKFDHRPAILRLKKLEGKERDRQLDYIGVDIPNDKQRLFRPEISRERVNLGYPPLRGAGK